MAQALRGIHDQRQFQLGAQLRHHRQRLCDATVAGHHGQVH
ncbi:Uncharacterised protein [Mycobacterium tuberculosis]|nr:Uncharacterised protein [Mycobacterium tuberculosis]CPA84259.1 Uncharacterised protein [Mycobacterium tuberculosis]